MNKLTVLEADKLIAEIEGHEIKTFQPDDVGIAIKINSSLQSHYVGYSPSIDNALCWELMIKHKVILYPEYDNTYIAKIGVEIIAKSESPRMAICLAIINHAGEGNG